jgi:hypothetical protein
MGGEVPRRPALVERRGIRPELSQQPAQLVSLSLRRRLVGAPRDHLAERRCRAPPTW